MRHGPRVYFLRWLDSFLPEERRRHLSAEALSRYRVLIGATFVAILLALPYLLALPAYQPSQRPFHAALGLSALAVYAGVLVLVRKRPTPTAPSLLLCGATTAGYIVATYLIRTPGTTIHATTMLIPALAVYLLGPRLGFFITLPFLLNMALVHRLVTVGVQLERPWAAELKDWVGSLMVGVSLCLSWALSWLYSSGREEAMAALAQREGQLRSVLESTDDVVCSLDAQGHVVTANPAAHALYITLFGHEPSSGGLFFGQLPPERQAYWRGAFERAAAGQRVREEARYPRPQGTLWLEYTINPVYGGGGSVVGFTVFGRDISARKEAETRLGELHRNLLDVSRQAGMAEIATGVLHNVGNTLNSVNVSANLVTERLRTLRVGGPARAAELLRGNAHRMASFLAEDSRGQQLPGYLAAISEQLGQERDALLAEVGSLTESLEHIKAVVSMQQQHARPAGLVEVVTVPQLLDDALHLHAVSFERLGIRVRCDYAPVPPLPVDRHKLLQILLNLLSNARHALLESGREDKQLTLRVEPGAEGRLRIAVVDNGVGVAPEHLPRLFTQGFTTKKTGHGFGLHISALAATEMGGALTCASEGPGQGATFLLELPPARTEFQT